MNTITTTQDNHNNDSAVLLEPSTTSTLLEPVEPSTTSLSTVEKVKKVEAVPDTKFRKGHKKMGGRRKGVPNASTEIHKGAMRRVRDSIAASGGAIKTPVEFLVDVYNNKHISMVHRIQAAKIVALIVHPSAPKVLNVKGGTTSKVEFSLLATDAHDKFSKLIETGAETETDSANAMDSSILIGEIVEEDSTEHTG